MPETVGVASKQRRVDRIALLITDITSPGLVVVGSLIAVTLHSSPTARSAVAPLAVSILFAVVLPYLFVAWLVRQRTDADRHVHGRRDRLTVLLVGLASTAAGLALLMWLDAPQDVLALVTAMTSGLIVVSILTRWRKVSMHLSVAAGAVTVMSIVFGAASALLVPLLGVVAWARYSLRHHTVIELLAGACAGAVVAGSVFPLLR